MPSVKLPRKSTFTDMTPFVDVAFLILSFFIMATKFKPPESVPIETPSSVNSEKLPDAKSVLISIDSLNRVFFTVLSQKDTAKYSVLIKEVARINNIGLTQQEVQNFRDIYMIGVPFSDLKQELSKDPKTLNPQTWPGIPVMDSTNNQLTQWIQAAVVAFSGETGFKFLIKGDNKSKFPAFEKVMEALKKNDQFKYNLVTSLEGAPAGSELEARRRWDVEK
jgi:biopolymer transport protein ExbD